MLFGRLRVRRAARGIDGARLAAALSRGAWLPSAHTLKAEGNSWVKRATIDGIDAVVKCRPLERPADALKAALGFGRADRHWLGAALLVAKSIPTARPLLIGHARTPPSRTSRGTLCELLVLEALPGRTLLEWLALEASAEVDPRLASRLAGAAGALVRTLATAGLMNRDHKPSNQIVTDAETGIIAVIDCVAIRRTYAGLERMLAQLWIEPAGCGVPARATLAVRALRGAAGPTASRAERRALWSAAAEIVRQHGDPRPRSNPLKPGETRLL